MVLADANANNNHLAAGLARWAAERGAAATGEFLQEWFAQRKAGGVEPWMDNAGQVSLVFQNPKLSAVVIRWGEGLDKYGHAHVCERVWSWALQGEVTVNGTPVRNDGAPLERADRVEIAGSPGALSVHVYQTEVANMVCHPTKCGCTANRKLVLCQGVHSVTDAERGASVSRVVSRQNGENVCKKSLRLYTNFRDLIELLHHEVESLAPGEVHSEGHIARITALLSAVRINESEYARYLRFHNKAYTRNLVGYDVPSDDGRAKFTVLILCWDKGQMSPIHDHAGSSCWVKVLQGQVREIRYEAAASSAAVAPRVIGDVTLGAQETCYINDTQGVHSMGNPNPDQVSVSLHVYAPPYVLCRLFDADTGVQRTGSMATARIPSNPFPWSAQSLELTEFYERVREAVASDNCDQIGRLVERLVLKEREWAEFVHFDAYRYTRSLVALEADFSLMVLCWNSGQGTPIHTHGSKVCSWVKVLRGCIVLKRYSGTSANPKLEETLTFNEGASIDCDLFKGMHILQNESDSEPAVTLHLYSPPFVQMAYLDSAGVDRVIPVVHSATSTKRSRSADPISICDKVIKRSRSAGGSFSEDLEDGRVDRLLSFFEQEKDPNVFTNLNALSRFIIIRGLRDEAANRHVLRALDRMHINPEEWHEFLLQRTPEAPEFVLIARGADFQLVLRRIDALTQTERKRPETCSWVKVLSGEVLHSQFLDGNEVHTSTLTSRAAVYVSNILESSFRNVNPEPCYLMQILL